MANSERKSFVEALNQVCTKFGSSWPESLALEDKNCSIEAIDDLETEKLGGDVCPKSALCCSNKCYQLGKTPEEVEIAFESPCQQDGTL